MNKRLLWIRIIAILAIFVSLFLTYAHYKEKATDFCVFGDKFDCDIVNKSPYSNLDGITHFLNTDLGIPFPDLYIPIPVAIISILVFSAVFALSFRPKPRILKTLMILSILFALYLLYVEIFILLAYCMYCIILDILILIETILIWKIK